MPPTKPPIITREQWGARQIQVTLYPARTLAELASHYDAITLHHDDGQVSSGMTQAQGEQRMRAMQIGHLAQGWADLGYHYVIDPAGRTYAGRTLWGPGAHVAGTNRGNLGICLMGRLHVHPPTKQQVETAVALCAWFCHSLTISPDQIRGHCDYLPTICPGQLHGQLPVLRARVRKLLK